jgi:hypothetical protein
VPRYALPTEGLATNGNWTIVGSATIGTVIASGIVSGTPDLSTYMRATAGPLFRYNWGVTDPPFEPSFLSAAPFRIRIVHRQQPTADDWLSWHFEFRVGLALLESWAMPHVGLTDWTTTTLTLSAANHTTLCSLGAFSDLRIRIETDAVVQVGGSNEGVAVDVAEVELEIPDAIAVAFPEVLPELDQVAELLAPAFPFSELGMTEPDIEESASTGEALGEIEPAPDPIPIEVVEPEHAVLELAAPDPVAVDVIEPGPAVAELAAPVFSGVGVPVSTGAAALEVAAPDPVAVDVLEPGPAVAELFAPAFDQPEIEPGAAALELVAPDPVAVDVLEPGPAIAELAAPAHELEERGAPGAAALEAFAPAGPPALPIAPGVAALEAAAASVAVLELVDTGAAALEVLAVSPSIALPSTRTIALELRVTPRVELDTLAP